METLVRFKWLYLLTEMVDVKDRGSNMSNMVNNLKAKA